MRNLKISLDVDEILRLYHVELKNVDEIAKIFKVNHGTIKLRLIKSGTKLRTTSEIKKVSMNKPDVKKRTSEASIRSQPKRKETNIRKYGSEVSANSINWKDDYEKEHGVRHPNQREESKEKMRGENNPAKRQESREKIKQNRWENKTDEELDQIQENQKAAWIKNLGVDNPLKSEKVKNKIRENSIKSRGVNWVTKDPEIQKKILEYKFAKSTPRIQERLKELNLELINDFIGITKVIPVKCITCGNIFESTLDYIFNGYGLCRICHPYHTSIGEEELQNFITSILPNYNIIFRDRKILEGKELDILIPDINIAFEFNGIYHHSEKQGIGDEYHLNKTEDCKNKGIQLIHIFEDEWYYHKNIVQNMIKNLLNIKSDLLEIKSEECKIKEISVDLKDQFLNQFHIQGKNISLINLGAFYNEELVSIMTFSKKSIPVTWELNRFCSNSNYHIPGIASKLLTYFKNNYEWKTIFSYCDRRWSNGNTYFQLGFNLDKITKPNYWYVNGMKRIHRFNLRKRPDEPKNITERELRLNEGYSRIWDCGNLKFTMISS